MKILTNPEIFLKALKRYIFDKEKKNIFWFFEYQEGRVNPGRKSESKALWKVCTHGEERDIKYEKKVQSFIKKKLM